MHEKPILTLRDLKLKMSTQLLHKHQFFFGDASIQNDSKYIVFNVMDLNMLSNLMAVELGINSITLYLSALFAPHMQTDFTKSIRVQMDRTKGPSIQGNQSLRAFSKSLKKLALRVVANVLLEGII